jgi:hypothetical protein
MDEVKRSSQAEGQEGQENNESQPLNYLISKKEHLVNISDELKKIPQWVCWRFEEDNGKRTKV